MTSFRTRGVWSTGLLVALTVGLSAQGSPAGTQAPAPSGRGAETRPASQDRPTFSVQIDLVTTDVIARDNSGNFVADLTRNDFEVYEDGVRQEIVSMTLSHGGRVTNVLAAPPPVAPEGIILPPTRRVDDSSGRIFVFFVDDLHLSFQSTPRVRSLFKKMAQILLHDGDMFGIVSSGPSSISVQMTYDKKRLDEAIEKITGDELKPSEIINGPTGSDGPAEVRYRAHVAMSTVTELLDNLEKVHNRRKALVYVSDGYDFTPFQAARLGFMNPSSAYTQNSQLQNLALDPSTAAQNSSSVPDTTPTSQYGKEEFADADLGIQLAQLTRIANRANTTIYTIDPRGLVASGDLVDEPIQPQQWASFIQKSQGTLRELAEDTGGLALVNQNDFDKGLKRIDAETSDYYVLGYYSTNPDPTRRLRRIQVKVTRPGVTSTSRSEYIIRSPGGSTSRPRR
jgi:VWFA-related protein